MKKKSSQYKTFEEYPTSSIDSAIGPVQVSEKSYDIQGNAVDSTQDTPIDVNENVDTDIPLEPMSLVPEVTSNLGSKDQDVVQENPQQTLTEESEE